MSKWSHLWACPTPQNWRTHQKLGKPDRKRSLPSIYMVIYVFDWFSQLSGAFIDFALSRVAKNCSILNKFATKNDLIFQNFDIFRDHKSENRQSFSIFFFAKSFIFNVFRRFWQLFENPTWFEKKNCHQNFLFSSMSAKIKKMTLSLKPKKITGPPQNEV